MHVQGRLILSQVGVLFPVNDAPETGVPSRILTCTANVLDILLLLIYLGW
jgi:hypothetical protein